MPPLSRSPWAAPHLQRRSRFKGSQGSHLHLGSPQLRRAGARHPAPPWLALIQYLIIMMMMMIMIIIMTIIILTVIITIHYLYFDDLRDGAA